MGFDPHTYLPLACKHCYNLFTCMALTTILFSMPPQSTLPDEADTAVLCSTDAAFLCPFCFLTSARPSPLLTLLSIHCDVFVTNFTCTLPLSSYPYFYRSLLPAIISFVSPSKVLPRHVSSQCDPNLFTANASLRDPQVSLLCFSSAQNNHEISWVEAACL